MRKLLALLVVLAGAIPLFGQGTSFPVFNRQGWTMAGAVVSVCNGPADPGASAIPCIGVQTTTYVDWTLTTTCTNMGSVPNPPGPPLGPTHGTGCTNPGLTDSHGNATIFAANGFYWAQVAGYQVVPQSFPFDIGSGGGGGGLTPCGQPTDIQNYFTNIALGCDTGIGILDPSQHLISENHLNANQQVSVGNGTANGLVCQGHSNGTAIDAAYCTQPSATFATTGLGYGMFPPDNQPTGIGNVVTVSSLTTTPVTTSYGSIGFYPTHFVSPTAVGNCSGLAGQDWYCAGPLPPTDPRSAVIQDNVCTIGNTPTCVGAANLPTCTVSGSNLSCTYVIGSSIQATDTAYVEVSAICGLGCSGSTFSISDNLGNTWTQIATGDGSGSSVGFANWYSHATAGATTITVVLMGNASAPYKGYFHFVELRGTVAPDGHAYNGSSTSGAPTFQAVTTTNATDTILGSLFVYNGSACTFAPGSLYGLIDIGSGTVSSIPLAEGAEATNVISTGSYTPPITTSCTGLLGSAFTTAFTTDLFGGPGVPFFRPPKYPDLVAGLDFPSQANNAGNCLASSGFDYQPLVWATCGSAGVTSIQFKNAGTNFGSPMTGVGSLNFSGCTVSGTTPNFTVTCTGTTVDVNGSPVSNPNFNGSSPSPDSSFIANTFKVSSSNVIVETPYGTNAAKGVVECDNSTISCTAGVIAVIGGGSMTWPSGGAGIPNYSGSSSWGTTYNASNTIPANFLPATSLPIDITVPATWSGPDPVLLISPVGATITGVSCATQAGTSFVVDVQTGTATTVWPITGSILSGTITCTTAGQTGTITSPNLTAGVPLILHLGTVTGSPNGVAVHITYTRGF